MTCRDLYRGTTSCSFYIARYCMYISSSGGSRDIERGGGDKSAIIYFSRDISIRIPDVLKVTKTFFLDWHKFWPQVSPKVVSGLSGWGRGLNCPSPAAMNPPLQYMIKIKQKNDSHQRKATLTNYITIVIIHKATGKSFSRALFCTGPSVWTCPASHTGSCDASPEHSNTISLLAVH